nr:MAG TPA: hypothetical protein [Caudoviricetes sp.]
MIRISKTLGGKRDGKYRKCSYSRGSKTDAEPLFRE